MEAESQPNLGNPAMAQPESHEAVATDRHLPSSMTELIVATPEEVTMINTGAARLSRKTKAIDENEPLIDTTAALTKRSKKTSRAQKRTQKKQQKAAARTGPASFLDLPAELLEEIMGHLRPSDIIQLSLTSRSIQAFLLANESAIARNVIRERYWVLARCFPLPIPFSAVRELAGPALLSDGRQNMLQIHKKPFQHVMGIDPLQICTCMSCVLAWNNLCMLVDLAHWQKNLNTREPIPMIPRGRNPEWNQKLLAQNGSVVEQAMVRPLMYALILQRHLETTLGTILRTFRGQKTVHPRRVYHLTQAEANTDTDEFLERSGPECHEFPFHRDNYYNLNAYIPNRKWSKEHSKWIYYAPGLHDRDLAWVIDKFTPAVVPATETLIDDFAASFKAQAKLQEHK